jgi:hypothetical protein
VIATVAVAPDTTRVAVAVNVATGVGATVAGAGVAVAAGVALPVAARVSVPVAATVAAIVANRVAVVTRVLIQDPELIPVVAGAAIGVAAIAGVAVPCSLPVSVAVPCSLPVGVAVPYSLRVGVAAFVAIHVGVGLARTVAVLGGIWVTVSGGVDLENIPVATSPAVATKRLVAGNSAVLANDADRPTMPVAVNVAVGNGWLCEKVPDAGNECESENGLVMENRCDGANDSVGQRLRNMQPGPQAVTDAERLMFHWTLTVPEKMKASDVRSTSNWQLMSAKYGVPASVLLLLTRFPLFPRNCELLSCNTTQLGAKT